MRCQCDSGSSPTGPPPAGRSGCSELTPSWRFIPHSTTRCAIFAEPSARFVWDRPISIRIMADKLSPAIHQRSEWHRQLLATGGARDISEMSILTT